MNADTTSLGTDGHTEPKPANVVELGNQICDAAEQTKAATDLEKRRAVTLRALEIAGKQLETDAQRFMEQAVVGDVPPKRRIELMEHAKCLFVSAGWLSTLTAPPTTTETATK